MNRPDELCIFFFNSAVLVAQLRENFGKGWQADPKLGLERQHYKSQVRRASQSTEILQRIGEGRASSTQSQAAAPARTVHFLQCDANCRKLGKIEAFI